VHARLNRLFAADGRCVNIAVDHGLFNEPSFLDGIRDIPTLVATLVAAAPDAIQLTAGQAHHLQDRPGAKPALVLRTDVANVYGRELPRHLFSEATAASVEQAVRLDAVCVVANLMLIPGHPEVHHSCVKNILALVPECERLAMPLMVEPLVMRPNEEAGGYQVDGDVRKIAALVRQAVELGAHVIKSDPTDDANAYTDVIAVAGGRPVLVRGGGKTSLDDLLPRIRAFVDQGAAGIVFGRNVFQHADPGLATRVLADVVHDRLDVLDAVRRLRTREDAAVR